MGNKESVNYDLSRLLSYMKYDKEIDESRLERNVVDQRLENERSIMVDGRSILGRLDDTLVVLYEMI